MSCYEWESGSITLPSSAVAGVRKALVDASNKLHDEVYEGTRAFIQRAGTRDPKKLQAVLYGGPARPSEHIDWALQCCVLGTPGPVKLPSHEQIDRVNPRATNRTTHFECGSEASVSITGRVVNWRVEENNHSVDRAHEHPVAQAFFRALDRVTWTRGTGGQFIGNNEYNRDNEYEGGGGNYVTQTFGPRSKAQLVAAASRW